MDTRTIVFRIQKSNGLGPYSYGEGWRVGPHHAATGRPGPRDDKDCMGATFMDLDAHLQARALFACPTLDALTQWFNAAERIGLASRGYRLTVWRARVLWASRRQCVFDPCCDDTELIAEYDLTEEEAWLRLNA